MIQVVETRLFSEGLHVLGQPPSPVKLGQYLEAYFGEGLSPEAVDVVSHSDGESLDAIKAKLQRIYSQVSALNQLLNCIFPHLKHLNPTFVHQWCVRLCCDKAIVLTPLYMLLQHCIHFMHACTGTRTHTCCAGMLEITEQYCLLISNCKVCNTRS